MEEFKTQIRQLLSTKDNAEFKKIFNSVKEIRKVVEIISQDLEVSPYTDHGIEHSLRVLYHAFSLADGVKLQLSAEELFLLITSCLLHDIGMFYLDHSDNGIDWQMRRQMHAENSVKLTKALFGVPGSHKDLRGFGANLNEVRKTIQKYRWPSSSVVNQIEMIILAHTKDSKGRETGWHSICRSLSKQAGSRLALLAALVRFADEIDLGKKRILDYNFFENNLIPLPSIEHWLAAAIMLEPKFETNISSKTIILNVDQNMITSDKELSDLAYFIIYKRYKKIIHALSKPITPGYPAIADIFAANGVSVFIAPIEFPQTGILAKDVSYLGGHWPALSRVKDSIFSDGLEYLPFSMQILDFPQLENVRACLVQEVSGLHLPEMLRVKIAEWIAKKLGQRISNVFFHIAFHRIKNQSHTLCEYLPDATIAPHSLIGAAAATKAFGCDINDLKIAPHQISVNMQLAEKDQVHIFLPDFSLPEASSGEAYIIEKWRRVKVVYDVPGKKAEGLDVVNKSLIYGFITSIGNVGFLVIPDQQEWFIPSSGRDLMAGAGINDFFSPPPDDKTEYHSWAARREELLKHVSAVAKEQIGFDGSFVVSIVGFDEEKDCFNVISCRDNSTIFPDYIHTGLLSVLYFVAGLPKKDYFQKLGVNLSADAIANSEKLSVTGIKLGIWRKPKNAYIFAKNDHGLPYISIQAIRTGEFRTCIRN